eukprot:4402297-Amphidinium_carterae.1
MSPNLPLSIRRWRGHSGLYGLTLHWTVLVLGQTTDLTEGLLQRHSIERHHTSTLWLCSCVVLSAQVHPNKPNAKGKMEICEMPSDPKTTERASFLLYNLRCPRNIVQLGAGHLSEHLPKAAAIHITDAESERSKASPNVNIEKRFKLYLLIFVSIGGLSVANFWHGCLFQ